MDSRFRENDGTSVEYFMQTFGIYIIGDETLSGKLEDKHLTQAISILKARGLPLGWAEQLRERINLVLILTHHPDWTKLS